MGSSINIPIRGDRRQSRWLRHGAVVAWLLVSASGVTAQQDFSKVEIRTTLLGSGIAMLEGAGGNLGVSTGVDGVVLIDDQYAPLTEKIRAAIAKLSPEPIRFVVNTHWHGDHTGGNENLGRGGALILAHREVRTRMGTEQHFAARNRTIPASPPEALPVVTYDEGVTLYLNGQTIDVLHVDPAHTDGDSIVFFREADVLHLGDTYFSGMYPFIDLSSGGRIEGVIASANRALELAGPGTKIIPGHGPLSSRADLVRYRDMLVGIRDRVRESIASGQDLEAVIAARPSARFDADFGGGFISPEDMVRTVYASLVEKGAPE